MPKEYKRSDRVADSVQRLLAECIRAEVRDPRVGMVNINAVEVTKDLSLASVYVTLVGESEKARCDECVEALNKASSFLRSLLGKQLTTRSVPRLRFVYDESAERGQVLSTLINQAIAEDTKNRGDRED